MADHDPLCTEHDSHWEPDECPECQAIARVRADEREEADHRLRMCVHEINDQVKNAVAAGQGLVLADLRAKVEGLVDDPLDPNEGANAVLALIDEAVP